MNILAIARSFDGYGGEKVADDLVRSWRADGHAVEVLDWSSKNPVVTSPLRRVLKVLDRLIAIRSVVRQFRPDLIVSFMTGANILVRLATLGLSVKHLASEHNVLSLAKKNDPNGWLLGPLVRLLYRGQMRIVAVSETVRSDLICKFAVPPPLVSIIWNPLPVSEIRSLAELGPALNSRYIICVGALRAAKRQHLLIEALQYLPKDVDLILAGDGILRGRLEALSVQLNVAARTHFLGFVENPYPLIKGAEALVLPSSYEGFGLVAAEAAALGTRVIGAGVPGLAEILHLVEGEIVEPQASAQDYARIIQRVLAEGRVPRSSRTEKWLLEREPTNVSKQWLSFGTGESSGGRSC